MWFRVILLLPEACCAPLADVCLPFSFALTTTSVRTHSVFYHFCANTYWLAHSHADQGVAGIGVVNAMEVVLAFPGLDGLCAFKEWVESPDTALVSMAAQKFGGNQPQEQGANEETGGGDTELKRISMGVEQVSK